MGQGDAGKCADPSFSCSAVDFGLLQEGLGPHFNGPRWGRESAGLQVQGFLCSEYPVEVGLHPGLELGFAFFCRWHFPIRQVRRLFLSMDLTAEARDPGKPEVRWPEREAIRDAQPGPVHDPHGLCTWQEGTSPISAASPTVKQPGSFWGFLAMPTSLEGSFRNQRDTPGCVVKLAEPRSIKEDGVLSGDPLAAFRDQRHVSGQ